MKNTSIYLLTFFLLLFASCEQFISDFEVENQESEIVINALLNKDSIIKVNISRSLDINENVDELPVISNASVYIYENGESTELTYTSNGYYVLNDKYPSAETSYTIKVSASGYDKASAVTSIPQLTEIISIDTSLTTEYEYDYSSDYYQFDITFKDNEQIDNYYALVCYKKFYNTECTEYTTYTDEDGSIYELCTEKDTFVYLDDIYLISYDNSIEFYRDNYYYYLAEEGYSNEGYKYFISDKYFNGKTKTLSFLISPWYILNAIDGQLYFHLYSLDESYYKFYKSLAQQNESGDNLFAEKITLYNNIENGLGLFSSYACDTAIVQLDTAFINEWY